MNAPKLDGLSKKDRRSVKSDAEKVASTLRFIEFRRVTGNKDKRNIRAQELIEATLVYLKLAAKRMTTGDRSERIMAWFDLQMAAESALKAAIQQASDAHPRVHPLNDLLRVAEIHGVKFDSSRLREWPNFKSMSDYRYGKGDPGGNEELFAAYLLTLDLARSAIDTIEPGLQSGFGVLLQYPPWKSRPEC